MDQRTEYVMCIVASPAEKADGIARSLVESKLAACVQIIPGITSFYRWEGKLTVDNEVLLFIKTRASLVENIRTFLASVHPYDVPEFIVIPIIDGLPAYFRWIDDSTKES
jgi:periplasmic divalent cation tolerance protein